MSAVRLALSVVVLVGWLVFSSPADPAPAKATVTAGRRWVS